ncbi:MAG: hypothetical protein RL033_1357, partial [Pseudomonadota bacterium]
MPRPPNVFSGPYLDRISHLRKDPGFVAEALASAAARVVVVHDSRLPVRRAADGWSPAYLETAQLQQLALTDAPVLLGQHEGCVYFAVEVVDIEPVHELLRDVPTRFEDLRVAGGMLPAQQAGVLAYARAMLHWRSRHRFC